MKFETWYNVCFEAWYKNNKESDELKLLYLECCADLETMGVEKPEYKTYLKVYHGIFAPDMPPQTRSMEQVIVVSTLLNKATK